MEDTKLTIDEIIEKIDEMPKAFKAQMYNCYQEFRRNQNCLSKVGDLFGDDIVYDITKIKDGCFIVERNWRSRKNEPNWFSLVIDGIRTNDTFETFEQALIGMANYFISGNCDAVLWAEKLMKVD